MPGRGNNKPHTALARKKISATKQHTTNIHKQRFAQALLEHYNVGITSEFADFYKKTRNIWLRAMREEPDPTLYPAGTEEWIKEKKYIDRTRRTAWKQMMEALQFMAKYSLPTFKALEVKGSPANKAGFNFNLGAADPARDEEEILEAEIETPPAQIEEGT